MFENFRVVSSLKRRCINGKETEKRNVLHSKVKYSEDHANKKYNRNLNVKNLPLRLQNGVRISLNLTLKREDFAGLVILK